MKKSGFIMMLCGGLATHMPAFAQTYLPLQPTAPATVAADADPNIQRLTFPVNRTSSATEMLGRGVYNQQGQRIGRIEDIILDNRGYARTVVVKDESLLGIVGKLLAVPYDAVMERRPEGDVLMLAGDHVIPSAREFSYEPSASADVEAMPDDAYSLRKILDGNLINPEGRKLADVDNITLRDGKADLLIVGYNRILNMGGDLAALDFDAAQPIRDEDQVDLRLGSIQTREFEDFKLSP